MTTIMHTHVKSRITTIIVTGTQQTDRGVVSIQMIDHLPAEESDQCLRFALQTLQNEVRKQIG